MNQFKNSWDFFIANWKYFLVLGMPLIAIESLNGYLVVPLQEFTQPEDFIEFFKTNSIIIALISVVGILLQISLIGGLWVSYIALDSQQDISPINALQAGLLKFFPLFGAYIIVNIASAFGFLLLILPGIYLTARFSLFAAHIMFENKKVFESIGASWEKTDEHGSRLFMFTLLFISLLLIVALILSSILSDGILKIFLLALSEYIIIIPLGYIYFTLYKSIKVT